MQQELGLRSESIIADVGSGTGILSELFLTHGNIVFAIEPNREMRLTAEQLLAKHSNFKSIQGTAEATTLPSASVDFITAGQAFHWFDPIKTKDEFSRILRPSGWTLLIWNVRKVSTSLMNDYQALLDEFANRQFVRRTAKDGIGAEGLHKFLGDYSEKRFENHQVLDFQSLSGRLLSSSYVPLPGQEGYEAMITGLRRIFDAHETGGVINFDYETEVYYSQFLSRKCL
jgi:ubiquinone/menaquinone biosynthesis C-methylase UbiE